MRVLLVSTYDLGRQPSGLASPAASLRQAGIDVECVDASRNALQDDQIRAAGAIAFYLPMHTATRLAAPLLERVRILNPGASLIAYGLYAPLNAAWLTDRGVAHVLGPEAEDALVDLMSSRSPEPEARSLPRVHFLQPDRTTLPPLERYAALQMPDGSRRVVGTTDATRGCKHLCRHCPIVPVYHGTFRAIPLDVVLADVRAQVAAGAEHITFGDPDFFNGPTHARKLVEQFAAEFRQAETGRLPASAPSVTAGPPKPGENGKAAPTSPGVPTYDVTIKIEHILKHADLLPLLRDTGCLFVTSAVEAVDDAVLGRLRKGHTRADFVRAAGQCREAGVTLVPTFVAFTPWTTVEGYLDLLDQIEALDLVEAVAPIQLAIRLLVTAESALLELPEIRRGVAPYDPQSLTWPWVHANPRVDALQKQVMQLVTSLRGHPRTEVFDAISGVAARSCETAGLLREPRPTTIPVRPVGRGSRSSPAIPYLTEAWYCCAEPGPEQFDVV
jgi:radical SAM superfamily enzyme YgiQ (UPF0313 family)